MSEEEKVEAEAERESDVVQEYNRLVRERDPILLAIRDSLSGVAQVGYRRNPSDPQSEVFYIDSNEGLYLQVYQAVIREGMRRQRGLEEAVKALEYMANYRLLGEDAGRNAQQYAREALLRLQAAIKEEDGKPALPVDQRKLVESLRKQLETQKRAYEELTARAQEAADRAGYNYTQLMEARELVSEKTETIENDATIKESLKRTVTELVYQRDRLRSRIAVYDAAAAFTQIALTAVDQSGVPRKKGRKERKNEKS